MSDNTEYQVKYIENSHPKWANFINKFKYIYGRKIIDSKAELIRMDCEWCYQEQLLSMILSLL